MLATWFKLRQHIMGTTFGNLTVALRESRVPEARKLGGLGARERGNEATAPPAPMVSHTG